MQDTNSLSNLFWHCSILFWWHCGVTAGWVQTRCCPRRTRALWRRATPPLRHARWTSAPSLWCWRKSPHCTTSRWWTTRASSSSRSVHSKGGWVCLKWGVQQRVGTSLLPSCVEMVFLNSQWSASSLCCVHFEDSESDALISKQSSFHF